MVSRIIVERHVPIPMRGGVQLHADIFRPDTAEQVPVILSRTPYEKGGTRNPENMLNPLRAAEAGFAVVFQDTRGRYLAEGEFYPFVNESRDGYDSVEWLAAQDWCSGAVGMAGSSYVGATQWLAALAQPPHLRAIAPRVTTSNYYDGWTYQGGAFQLGFTLTWTMNGLAPNTARRGGSVETALGLVRGNDRIDPHYAHLPLKTQPLLRDSKAAGYYFDWLDHASYDDYWKATAVKEQYGNVQVPALNVGGWYDIFLGGTLENFRRMQAEGGSDAARQGQRLIVGPWSHNIFTGWFPEINFGTHAGLEDIDITAIQLRYFEQTLKGRDNGWREEAPVRLFVMGLNEWRSEREWPLARTEYSHWYLHGGGALSPSAPADESPDTYRYDPANPTPTIGGPTILPGGMVGANSGPRDQRLIEARSDVLVFTSDILQQPLEVTGPLTVTLYAATSAPDTDFVAKLTDVYPDGASMILAEGIIRVRYRQGTDMARPITPGEVDEYTIDLVATSNVFLPGHRIRLDVCSASFPRFDRNLNSGRPLGEDTLADAQIAQQTIFHDRSRPSHILLPVIPTSPPNPLSASSEGE